MKCRVSRKNRDRRGGHKPTASVANHSMDEGAISYTPAERSLIKKIGRKKMRRQHRMTTLSIGLEIDNNWTLQDEEREQFLDENWYDDEPFPMVPYTMEELEPEPIDWADPFYDDWDYWEESDRPL